jgi:Ca2+-binding EF-hand superfamily protein
MSAALLGLIPNAKGDPLSRAAVDKLRARVATRGAHSLRTLGRVLRSLDSAGSRKLSRALVQAGFREFGVDPDSKDLAALLKLFDRRRDGTVDVDELLLALRGNLAPRRRETVQRVFDVLDTERAGSVATDALTRAVRIADERALADFLAQWDSASVSREDFLDYYKDVSAAFAADADFDAHVRAFWGLDAAAAAAADGRRVIVIHSTGAEELVTVKDDLGMDPANFADVKARLEKQGIADIADIHICP